MQIKKINLLSLLLILGMCNCLFSQSNFDINEYRNYCELIKNLSFQDLLIKHTVTDEYYSDRFSRTEPNSFQYMDSIESRYGLTSYEKELIADNHFMVTERLSFTKFSDAYHDIYVKDLPLFLSTDLFLHALHLSYDALLKEMENEYLIPNLKILLSSLREQLIVFSGQHPGDPEITQSVEDVDLYLSVAYSLLTHNNLNLDYGKQDDYQLLLNAIYNQDPSRLGIKLFSESYTREIDISQFKVRGHYTENEELQNYFRAMTWLGRIDFLMTLPPDASNRGCTVEDIVRMTRSAMLLNKLINNSGDRNLLEYHAKIIGFFVGPEDNFSPFEFDNVIAELGLTFSDLNNVEKWEEFQKKIKSVPDYGQMIMSDLFIVDASSDTPIELPVSYRLMGQKFVIDSYIFSQLVFDRIVVNGKKIWRPLPDPLDAMFVLGNDNALPLLKDEINRYQYAYKLEELRYLVDHYDPDFWNDHLYNSWLKALRTLNPKDGDENLPYFMKTVEWQLEKLNTQLSSWTELRHDNILYVKQSYTGIPSCSFPYVFVEPYPEFYNALADLAENAGKFFENEIKDLDRYFKSEVLGYFSRFMEHMDKLSKLSEKELNRESFNEDDMTYLKTFYNLVMGSDWGDHISGWYNELVFMNNKSQESDYLVADIHTQPTDESGFDLGRILHIGTGHINLGVFCAGSPFNDYQPAAFVGPVMSFHQMTMDNWNRLSDEEWEAMFSDSSANPPGRPDWVWNYLAPSDPDEIPPVPMRNLKGSTYFPTSDRTLPKPNGIAYMLAFPNPASDYSSVRFILNYPADVHIAIFDITGKKIREVVNGRLIAGEHKKEFSVENLEKGLYLLRISTGMDQESVRLVIQN